jgi:hypothetical protein
METMQYHCFNGDCDAHMSAFQFLKKYGKLDPFTPSERHYMKEVGRSRSISLKKIRSALGLETFFSEEIEDLSVDREFLMKKLHLIEIKGTQIERYLKNRLQTDYENFAWHPRSRQIYVFNLTKEDRIIGLQIKTFKKKNPYITWKLTRIHQELGIFREENAEILKKMDLLSNMFGIFKANLSKPLTIFEGPLDSFLFPNSVGLCSAKNSLPFEVEGSRYFYDNDETGREWSIKRIEDGKSVFLWRKYIEENELSSLAYKIKDLNDLLIIIRKSGRKFKRFVDYFSDSRYDAIWI